MFLEGLPVELLAEILGELDLENLLKMSYLSKRFYLVASDNSLNPWRKPIARNLNSLEYEKELKHLSVRAVVPRHNWIEILTSARPSYVLFEATLPNLKSADWEECFKRRFLPSWKKWKKGGSWKEAYLKLLHRVWHRSTTFCKADESWTKYMILKRNGAANVMEVSTRNFNPVTVFNEYKLQSNLSHLNTRIVPVLQLSDVRILALGTFSRSYTDHTLNTNAHMFLNPPGIVAHNQDNKTIPGSASAQIPCSVSDVHETSTFYFDTYHQHQNHYPVYTRLRFPQPSYMHRNYPFFTPGTNDVRWSGLDEIYDNGCRWVGSLMIVAQLLGPSPDPQNTMFNGNQFASFDWTDLLATSPWVEDFITQKIEGAGLGH